MAARDEPSSVICDLTADDSRLSRELTNALMPRTAPIFTKTIETAVVIGVATVGGCALGKLVVSATARALLLGY